MVARCVHRLRRGSILATGGKVGRALAGIWQISRYEDEWSRALAETWFNVCSWQAESEQVLVGM